MGSARPLLIFDLDDTLIESFPGYVQLHQRVAHEMGWPVPSLDDLVEYGHGWTHTLRRLWPDRDVTEFQRRYDRVADDVVYGAFPGVLDALSELHAAGHSMWIVSKRSRRRIHSRVRAAGIAAEMFEGIFAHEDQPAPKPDPRCFEPVWSALGERRHAVYVGDRSEDRAAARAAGLRFVAVRTGPEARRGVFDDLPSDAVVDTAAHIPTWLRRFEPDGDGGSTG